MQCFTNNQSYPHINFEQYFNGNALVSLGLFQPCIAREYRYYSNYRFLYKNQSKIDEGVLKKYTRSTPYFLGNKKAAQQRGE